MFYCGSTNDYYFFIKELAEVFNGQVEQFREITEKYITFSVPLLKKLANGKKVTH